MTFRERLRRAMRRRNLRQYELAEKAGLGESAVSDILRGETANPSWDTVERLIRALDMTFSEFFDEPHIRLSPEDVELVHRSRAFLGRLLESDATLKEVSSPNSRISSPGPTPIENRVLSNKARKAEALKNSDVTPLENEPIPAKYQVGGRLRAYRVQTDALLGAGIMVDATIYVRRTTHEDAADGQLVVCHFRDGYLLRRLDLTGGHVTLHSGNPLYDAIHVDRKLDKFALIGVVIRPDET